MADLTDAEIDSYARGGIDAPADEAELMAREIRRRRNPLLATEQQELENLRAECDLLRRSNVEFIAKQARLERQWADMCEALDMRRDAKPDNCIMTARAFNERNDRHVLVEDGLRAEIERLRIATGGGGS